MISSSSGAAPSRKGKKCPLFRACVRACVRPSIRPQFFSADPFQKEDDPLTWDALKSGDFCVRKSDTPFSSLFVDQTLEQEIKKLKGVGGITGLTQQDELLDQFLLIQPELARIVADFQNRYTKLRNQDSSGKEHYQLFGEYATSIATNAETLRDSIQVHCEGNPYLVGTPLKNIVSSVIIPHSAALDILHRDDKGQLA